MEVVLGQTLDQMTLYSLGLLETHCPFNVIFEVSEEEEENKMVQL